MFVERAFEVKYLAGNIGNTSKSPANNLFCDPPPAVLEAQASSCERDQGACSSEIVTPLRKNETMTATAFALDPALDLFDDVDTITPRRPQLRLIEGEGYGHSLATTEPAASAVSVEVFRRRRFLALVAITVLVLGIAWAAGISVVNFSGPTAGADAAPAVHVVVPGDSYAAIASDLGVANPIAAAEQLRAANGGSELIVGQRLVVDLATLAATLTAAG
jgi:hypothetical protein